MITNKEVRISVNKTLTRKLIYVVAALTLLAMLIPAMAVPVSANPGLQMFLIDPITGVQGTTADSQFNIQGSRVLVTSNDTVTWSLVPTSPVAHIIASDSHQATVEGYIGNVDIVATVDTGTGNVTSSINKKFGQISEPTILTTTGNGKVTWNEEAKVWRNVNTPPDVVTETVNGLFDGTMVHAMQGVILNWYLLPAGMAINMSAAEYTDIAGPGLKTRFDAYLNSANTVQQVSFADWGVNNVGPQVRYTRNVTNALGQNSVTLYAKGQEAVQIIVIPEYPGDPEVTITPERIFDNFWTDAGVGVPQIRWAGEKIVLEKYFGPTYNGKLVKFSLENQSVGELEGINPDVLSDNGSLWVTVQNGFASAILYSTDQGVGGVAAALYEKLNGAQIGNQHHFVVYFLEFESLTIGDVQGKRQYHNAGLWNPTSPNPWSTATDSTTQTLNVSQDALVRAQVKGWYYNASNQSTHAQRTVDPNNSTLNNPGSATLTLPYGRWILPDDWAIMGTTSLKWDIMNSPDGGLLVASWVGSPDSESALGLGNYYKWKNGLRATVPNSAPPVLLPLVGNANVIGPFSPGIELMTATGWEVVNAPEYWDMLRQYHTIVQDGAVNSWDAPMPPAKITYDILNAGTATTNGAGYFKPAMKTDIYYTWATNTLHTEWNDDPLNAYDQYLKIYTNPFYQEMIPAHPVLMSDINNGTYEWESFNSTYGAYIFWEFFSQNGNGSHPTSASVFSDNHGEAMIWLNGDWNLNLNGFINDKGAADVPSPNFNTVVGTTNVQATAEYPFFEVYKQFKSNTDTKTWIWGGWVLGAETHLFGDTTTYSDGIGTRMVLSAGSYTHPLIGSYPFESAASIDKVVWIWVADRDGGEGPSSTANSAIIGAKVDWKITPLNGSGVEIQEVDTLGHGISQYNDITKNIQLVNGFLAGTNGVIDDGANRLNGHSYLRKPTSWEKQLFNKFWGSGYSYNGTLVPPTSRSVTGLNPDNFCVAAIDLLDLTSTVPTGSCNVTITIASTDFNPSYTPDVAKVVYKTNVNFQAADPLDDAIRAGDANCDGVVNMGDVTAVERMILGYNTVTSNAILNNDGTVDMGTVVKIERTILGLK